MTLPEIDQSRLQEMQALLTRLTSGAFVTAMAALGIRLGLFGAMADAGPLTPEDLGRRTGMHERWLREWLRCMGAGGLVDYEGEGRFRLSAEAALLLASPESTAFAGNRLASFPERMKVMDKLPQAFRTGLGYTWDDRGEDAVLMTEAARRSWYQNELATRAVPLLDGVAGKLTAGARVADLGCGTGIALIELAKVFPASQYHGYEISQGNLDRAARNLEASGAQNVHFHNALSEPLPGDGSFDLVLTFDVLHDMTHPETAAAGVRQAVKPDGTWFILEIDCAPTYEGNLERSRELAALGYATSIMNCLASGMSEPGGAGLGTLGLPEPVLRDLVTAAGFSRFRRVEMKTPHALYEVRP